MSLSHRCDVDDLVAALRGSEAALRAAELGKIHATLDFAAAHEVSRLEDAAFHADCEEGSAFDEHGLALAGTGAPLMAESAVAEAGVAWGVSTDSARGYLGAVLEVRHRLPRLWEQVTAGRCTWWRARRIAESTTALCEEGAEHVDRHLGPVAHAVSGAQVERTVAAALLRWDPEAAEAKRAAAAESRHVTLGLGRRGTTELDGSGTVPLTGCLDVADALDLETALADRARELGLLGCDESLAVRRSLALGDLARHQQSLALVAEQRTGADGGPVRLPVRRRVVLHVHLSGASVTAMGDGAYDPAQHGVARLANLREPVSAAQARSWCAAAHVTVRPVLDLNGHLHSEAYEAPAALAEQTRQRDLHCVFPHCSRPADSCDLEHAVAWPAGPTSSANQAPMCRRHHRHKTHHGWAYEVLTPGSYLWTSPGGQRSLRLPEGTFDLTPAPRSRPPARGPDHRPHRPPSRVIPAPRRRDDPSPAWVAAPPGTTAPAPSDGRPPPF